MTLERIRDFIRPMLPALLAVFLLCCALLSGVMEAIVPGLGVAFTKGTAGFLTSVPSEFYALFGTLGLGYTVARSVDKRTP
ncbi:hypothetical protein QQS45_08370 [Alteriqipengyuania flavescens]|uniref:hypothetical protein n=1 Tax=Alteriqipengyuania flavescens TaxID=3053610 RepID=UPI0025B5037C|nr:hypothetical protein [Alteriqipengyuania flavescens]WJY17661.1 hypothetical protein QQW98_08365 [Alteriqipengyuania flavescens]WJY23604.1 hypothetical protein QQS45_08370 [Alteriqipengyuania flavescens]